MLGCVTLCDLSKLHVENYKMPKLSFDMISDEEKEKHATLMLIAGNTSSPLFKLCSNRYPSKPKGL